MFKGIDFYSDTITKPSEEMKQAMMDAPVGDEQRGEDPTTKKLEDDAKILLNKNAAMFFPSATMCNQIAVRLQTKHGDEIIGADNCHIFNAEGAGVAFHSGAQARMIQTKDGTFDGENVKAHFRHNQSPHAPRSALLLVENTTNMGGGVAWSLEKLSNVWKTAKELNLLSHLDGSRLFNAAVVTGCSVGDLSVGFDTVTICFSKGLGCPAGAILAFDQKNWTTVRRLKQVFGGAMRQSGILAGACLYALEHNLVHLAVDHKHARVLAKGLEGISGVIVENNPPMTNMVFFALDQQLMDPDRFLAHCLEHKLRFYRAAYNRFRAVTHKDVSLQQIEEALHKVRKILENREERN